MWVLWNRGHGCDRACSHILVPGDPFSHYTPHGAHFTLLHCRTTPCPTRPRKAVSSTGVGIPKSRISGPLSLVPFSNPPVTAAQLWQAKCSSVGVIERRSEKMNTGMKSGSSLRNSHFSMGFSSTSKSHASLPNRADCPRLTARSINDCVPSIGCPLLHYRTSVSFFRSCTLILRNLSIPQNISSLNTDNCPPITTAPPLASLDLVPSSSSPVAGH